MKDYEAQLYDVVMLIDINQSENFRLLELEEKEEYMVSYVFADGSCVLYKEKLFKNKELAIYEYVVEEEDVKYLSLLYNYMDEYDDNYSNDNYAMKGKSVKHNFKVGEYVYFENVNVIEFYQEAELRNHQPYEITALSELDNCPFIMTPIGELELYPKELKYLKRYNDDAEKDVESNADRISEKERIEISESMDEMAYEIAMDKALAENDIDKAQEIYNLHNGIK